MDMNCESDFISEQDNAKSEPLLCNVINEATESPKPFICLKDLNNKTSNTDRRLDETPVNQVSVHSDWPKSTSTKVTKLPVNGTMHSSAILDIQNSNRINSMSLRPSSESSQNQCYVAPPTLKEAPLPSKPPRSPVPKIKQLNCSSPVAI